VKRIITAVTVLCMMEVTAMADNTTKFETDAVGGAPKGWTATMTGKGDPKWTVEQDQTAPSKSKILKQSGQATYPLLLKENSSVKDGFIEVKFKAIAGSEDRAAGLVWRAKDANNYYVVRANALEDNVVLYKTVSGVRSSLDIVGRKGGYGVNVAVPANQWHALRVDFSGSRFRVTYNGKQLFEVEDSTFGDAGKVGLWTKADSVTLFDEVSYGEAK
jgi:3-keto-disaccharide hydrolase